ncbi:MAG: hypothetical protein II984_08190 [Clostridia bacterium]|nr:hypothetical protein [Clostridia bacterium]
MIRIRSYDLKSILILSVFKIFLLIGIIMMFLSKNDDEQIIVHVAIILGFIGFLFMLQILIYLLTYKKVLIDAFGITICEKSNKKTILWNEVKLFTYYNEMVILEPNTLKVKYGNNEILLGKNYSNIHISLKKYKEAINFIPKEILKNNDLFLYETLYLYKQDKYKLYSKSVPGR